MTSFVRGKIHLVTVGKLRRPGYEDAVGFYSTRLNSYVSLEQHIIKTSDPEREARDIFKILPKDKPSVLLEEKGKRLNSQRFATWMGEELEVYKELWFVMGGPYGLPDRKRASFGSVINIAPWTLPHELAKLVLMEQLYRAFTILQGHPYHH